MKKFLLGILFGNLALISIGQTNPKITGKPIIMVLPQKDSAIAFRMTSFLFGDKEGISLVTDPQTKSLLISSLHPEFDLDGCIKNQKFVATHDGIYHFDARVNFFYPLEDRLKFFRWYLKLMSGNKVIEETVLTGPDYSLDASATHVPSPQHSLTVNTNVLLRKGDVVSLWFTAHADPGAYVTASFISFSGFKVANIPAWTRPDIR